ncbi:MAG: 2Fe-2S iron-sulfur cluster-binding protein [Bacteroidota bacterium]|nr:2Fe-2S iron-sulfur cluster-binding protein [Bacteroidota bacterium]MDP4212965.1 2Fe-2S iron-sulfur cluster-binding protein [Bacteroidota bacterium]MDP4250787.1 2Fe-2S iron-sulfur cluster-binding protein [Bacteroidota bacterium]
MISPSTLPQQDPIHITVVYEGDAYELDTYEGEYRNLMMLIFDSLYTEEFGECKGMGRCGSCLVEILSSGQTLDPMERNEESTIKKMTAPRKDIRLACQLLINSSLKDIKIKILREYQ